VPYPHFIDVRSNNMDQQSPIVSNLPAITLNWTSPITLDEQLNADRQVSDLLKSTADSWETTDSNIQPNTTLFPEYGFPVDGEKKSYTLAVAAQGSFQSFFKGKDIPVPPADPSAATTGTDTGTDTDTESAPTGTPNPLADIGMLEQSPETSRLVVVGSGEFLNDNIFQISQSFSGDRYLNSLQLVQNAVDWFVQDTELATIRVRGSAARVLDPLTEQERSRWEIINYALGLLSLGGIGAVWRLKKRAEKPIPLGTRADDAPDQGEQESLSSGEGEQ
jgi:ABC-2 type transport system permease protein